MQVQNLETKTLHDITLEHIGRCECCGDHIFNVLIDGEVVQEFAYLPSGLIAFDGKFIFDKTINDLRKESGYLSLEEFLSLE